MKKLLFAAYSFDIGGIEKALITLVNYLQAKEYEITIVLEKKQGIFLKDLNSKIKVITYCPDESKNIIKRKIINLGKRIKFITKYRNKFDFAASFATYCKSSSFVSRVASKNSCLWGHADYLTLFNHDEGKVKDFFNELKYKKFKHIVFVSKEAKNNFIKIFPEMEKKTIVCNNLVDDKKILEMSNETIELSRDSNQYTFINVGRHDEKQKKLTRIISASERLKNDGSKFRVLLIGDGKDTEYYKKLVKEKNLEDIIYFLGAKKNPYPYFKISDCVLLTSDYEGYPVVFLESFILNKPILTTKVSDYEDVEQGYGMVMEKDEEDIYNKMKEVLNEGLPIQKKFDADKYNEDIIKKLETIF